MGKIYGPIKNKDRGWKISTNGEIDLLIEYGDTVTAQRLRCAGRVIRMDKGRTAKGLILDDIFHCVFIN